MDPLAQQIANEIDVYNKAGQPPGLTRHVHALAQRNYDALNAKGYWRRPENQAMAHALRAHGFVQDNTQGGFLPQAQRPSAPPRSMPLTSNRLFDGTSPQSDANHRINDFATALNGGNQPGWKDAANTSYADLMGINPPAENTLPVSQKPPASPPRTQTRSQFTQARLNSTGARQPFAGSVSARPQMGQVAPLGTKYLQGVDGKMYPATVLPGGVLKFIPTDGRDPFAVPGTPVADDEAKYGRIVSRKVQGGLTTVVFADGGDGKPLTRQYTGAKDDLGTTVDVASPQGPVSASPVLGRISGTRPGTPSQPVRAQAGPLPTILPRSQWGTPGTPIYEDATQFGGVVSRQVVGGNMTVAKFGKLRQGKPIERYYGSQAEGGRRLSVHDPRVRVYTESDDPQGLGTRTVDFILKHLDPTGQLSDNKAGSAVDRGIGAMASGIGNGLSAAFKDWLETENQRYGVGDRTEALRIEKQAADVLGHGVGNLAAGIGGAPFSAAQMFTTVYASPFNKQAGQEVDKFADANLNSWGVGPDGPITKIAHGNIKGGVNQLLDKAWENPVDAVTLLLGGYQALRGGYQAVGMMREGLIAGAARVEAKAQAAGNTPLGQSLKARAATIRAQAARLGNALNDHVAQTKFSGSEPPLEQPHTRLSSETSASAAAPALVSADPWIQASNDPATALKGKSEISYYRTTQGDVFPRGSISTDIHGKPIDLNRVLEVYDTQGNLVWKRGNGHSPTVTPPPQLEDSWYARVIGRRIPKDASQTIQAKPGQAKQTVDNAIAAIDKVHRVGHVGKIAIVTDKSTKDINARGHYNGDPADFHIAVAHDGPWPALTFVHEYGHFLDHSGFFGAKRFASLSPKHLNEWRKIVMNSQAIKDLKDAQANSGNITERNGNQVFTMSQKRLAYLLDEREIFARSYAQYIATRSGDPTLVNDLNNALSHGSSKVHRELWEPDDFKPIADEFDKLFANHRGKP